MILPINHFFALFKGKFITFWRKFTQMLCTKKLLKSLDFFTELFKKCKRAIFVTADILANIFLISFA